MGVGSCPRARCPGRISPNSPWQHTCPGLALLNPKYPLTRPPFNETCPVSLLLLLPLSALGPLQQRSVHAAPPPPFVKPINGCLYPQMKFQTPSQGLEGSPELPFAFLPITRSMPTPASGLSLGVTSSGKSSLMDCLQAPTAAASKHVPNAVC